MRIAVLGRALAHDTGIARYARSLLTALSEQNGQHEYVLFCNRSGYVPARQQRVVVEERHNPISILFWEHVRVPRAALRAGCDLFYSPDFLLPLRSCGPSVVTVHDMGFLRWPRLTGWKARAYYGALIGRTLRRADAVIAVSEFTRSEILHFFPHTDPGKIAVVYEGPGKALQNGQGRVSRAREALGLDRDYILYVGLLGGWKNVEGLVVAYAVARSNAAVTEDLVLCGKTCRATGRIREAVNRHGVAEHVRLLGFVDDEHLDGLIAGARAFVSVSLYEGFGLPPLEAMALGIPTIVSNTSALAEVAGPGARTVDPTCPDAIADAIVSVLQDETEADRLRAAGPRRAAEFSWDRAASETLQVFEAAVTP